MKTAAAFVAMALIAMAVVVASLGSPSGAVTLTPSYGAYFAHRTGIVSADTYTYQPGDVNPVRVEVSTFTTMVDTHDSVTIILKPWFRGMIGPGSATNYCAGDTILCVGPTMLRTQVDGNVEVIWGVESISSAIGTDTSTNIYINAH